jgi:hypothetical protein
VIFRDLWGVVLEDVADPPWTLRAPLLAMNRSSCESRVTERTAELMVLRLIDGVPVDF